MKDRTGTLAGPPLADQFEDEEDPHSLMKGKLQLRLTQMVEKLRPLNTSATMEK